MNRKVLFAALAPLAALPLAAQEVAADAAATAAAAAAKAPAVSAEMFTVNNLWILLGAILVFAMHPGFALVETGLSRAKNSVNILAKNFITVAIGLITYLFVGFNLMYPGESWIFGHFLGFGGLGRVEPRGCGRRESPTTAGFIPTGRTSSFRECSPRPPSR